MGVGSGEGAALCGTIGPSVGNGVGPGVGDGVGPGVGDGTGDGVGSNDGPTTGCILKGGLVAPCNVGTVVVDDGTKVEPPIGSDKSSTDPFKAK